ncbi:MAG TPA: hypothetical protein VMV41_12670 [Cellulomonadaceae bacterium]|nr:hypothetical protein [Cellulomonadaceae bacterium]
MGSVDGAGLPRPDQDAPGRVIAIARRMAPHAVDSVCCALPVLGVAADR